jgi:hypothetical protein
MGSSHKNIYTEMIIITPTYILGLPLDWHTSDPLIAECLID